MGIKTWVTYGFLAYIIYRVISFVKYQLLQRKFKAKFAPNASEWPFGLDFVKRGNDLSYTFKNLEFFTERAQKYSATHGCWALHQYLIFTTEPENIKAILATQFTEFGKGDFFQQLWNEFLGQGIFNADGPSWSHSRALLRPQFLKERVADLHNFEHKIKRVFDLIKPGEVTDAMDIWFRFTLDAATEHLFGACADSLTGDNSFASNFAKVQELQTKRARHGPLVPFFPAENKELTAEIAKMDEYVQKYVNLALAKDSTDDEDGSLLAVLVRDNRDPVFLRDALVSMLLAGRDTTAATLTWATKHLSESPDLWRRLREEVFDIIGADGQPTYSQLKNMKVLQAIINETLRLYPIVPMNVRTSFKDTTLPRGGGPDGKSPVLCPAGTQVIYSALVMQRMQPIPDASTWIPDRWLDPKDRPSTTTTTTTSTSTSTTTSVSEKEAKYTPAPWTYVPFNGGPRICLGQNFALTEIAYALTRMAQRYAKMENRDAPLPANDYGYRYDIILTPRFGCKVLLTEA